MENCSSDKVHSTNAINVPFDPGWNDPPKFSYSTQQAPSNRPRNFLNKRVAFPLSSTGSTSAPAPTVNLPPVGSKPISTSIPQKVVHIEQELNIEIDTESALKEVKDILLEHIESISELGPKSNNIRKKISVMEEMWSSGKLNKKVQMQMKELAYALQNEQFSKADDIHKLLMVDDVSAVGTWMPGVKQLIHHCIACSELLAIDKEEQKCNAIEDS